MQDIDIIATYSDASGAVRIGKVKMSHLSSSWILENPNDRENGLPNSSQVLIIDYRIRMLSFKRSIKFK